MSISNVILGVRRGKLGLLFPILLSQTRLPLAQAQIMQSDTPVKVSIERNDQMFNFDDLRKIPPNILHDLPVQDVDPTESYVEDDKNNKRSSKQYHARGEQKLKSVVGKKPVYTNSLLMGLMDKRDL